MDFYAARWMERETHANQAENAWTYPDYVGTVTKDGEALTKHGVGLAPSPLKMQITVEREGCEPLVVLGQSPIGLPIPGNPVTTLKYESPVFLPCQTKPWERVQQEIFLSVQADPDDESGMFYLQYKMSEGYHNMPGKLDSSVFLRGNERVSVVGPETVVVDRTLESGLRLQLWIQH